MASLSYADSLLSAYLTESKDTLLDPPDTLPVIAVEDADASAPPASAPAASPAPSGTPTFISIDRRVSVVSLVSSYNSLYSLASQNSEDLDLESVRVELAQLDKKPSRMGRLRKLWKHADVRPLSDSEQFVASVTQHLQRTLYHYDKRTTLNVPWATAAETLMFGQPLDALFRRDELVTYLMESAYELGEVRFSNMSRFHAAREWDVGGQLDALQERLARFNDVLDLYAELDSNIKRPELFELFSEFANSALGLPIPLAVSMFGNWLLTYSRDAAVESNYQNTLILDYFRKAARLTLVVRKLAPVFDAALLHLDKKTQLEWARYWNKDNTNALATSLHSLGEYYQYVQDHDMAVTLWELNCHLTGDADLGRLAVLGLTNGYGLGNHNKQHNKFGKVSKTNKFNTKRRIAHLYRILMQLLLFDEYGVSWVTKEKYD